MRINLRAKIKNYTVFFMLSKNCTLLEAMMTLLNVQLEFHLGRIFITSDYPTAEEWLKLASSKVNSVREHMRKTGENWWCLRK